MIRIKNNATPRLPNEYQEVEYIQSTGTQYINTNYKITPNTEIVIDGMIIGAGYFVVAGSYGYYMSGIYGNNITLKICARWRNEASSNLTVTTSEDIGENRHTFKLNKTAFYMDNVNVGNFNSTYNFSATDDIYIFGLGEVSMSVGRLYSMTISDNGVLVRKLIPCYRKSDNEIGLYDLVNNVFYTNAGTGVFLMSKITGKVDMNLVPMVGSKKVIKRYIGENLVYRDEEIYFTSCLFPTSWTYVNYYNYYAIDNYGKWVLTASGFTSSTYSLEKAFDDDLTTYFRTTTQASTSEPRWAQIDLPDGVLIKPDELSLTFRYTVNTDEVQGYNPDTNEWETIEALGVSSSSKQTKILNYTGSTYFSKFRVYSTNRYSTSGTIRSIWLYEFKITSGMLRKEN